MTKSVIAITLLIAAATCLPAGAADMLATANGKYPAPPVADHHRLSPDCQAFLVDYRAPYLPRRETVTICYAQPVDLRPPPPLG